MPLNFAIFDYNIADEVISKFPNIKNWAISGHSLGGVMAAKYASENSNIEGVILYASYPQGDELKDSNVEVTSIYGSLDGVANLEKISDSKNLLPSTTTFIEIAGVIMLNLEAMVNNLETTLLKFLLMNKLNKLLMLLLIY